MFRILIVDDEPFVLESFHASIDWNQEHCTVVGKATSGLQALELAASRNPDVVFTDIRMPQMDGLDLTRRLRKALPQVPVVIVTGHADFEYARSALQAGAFGFCLKPFDPAEIVPVLRQACENRAGAKRLPLGPPGQDFSLLPPPFRPTVDDPLHCAVVHSRTQAGPPGEWEFVCLQLDCFTHAYLIKGTSVSALRRWVAELNAQRVQGIAVEERITDETELKVLGERLRVRAYSWFLPTDAPGNRWSEASAEIIRELHQGQWDKARELISLLRATPGTPGGSIADLRFFLGAVHGVLNNLIPDRRAEVGFLDYDGIVAVYSTWRDSLAALEDRIWAHASSIAGSAMLLDPRGKIPAILAFLRSHYQRPVGLPDLSAHVGLTESYISTLFRKEMGETVVVFLNRIRVEQAIRLLTETRYSLEEIADRVGFSNSFYFSRVFKTLAGTTPSSYRKNHEPSF